MPYCSKCGVELPPDAELCILCKTPVQFPPIKENIEKPYPAVNIPDKTIGIMVWIISTTLFFIVASVLLTIGIFLTKDLKWCIYPISGLTVAWVYISIAIFFIRKKWIVGIGWIIATILFLAVLNFSDSGENWFLPLGVPITLSSGIALMVIVSSITHFKSVSAILATIFATLSLLCIEIDFNINFFLGKPQVGWSIIVLSSIIPIEILLGVYYFYLRKRIDVRRYFHI